jgi:enoyl-CoA hydratase/carnithine racemase
LVDRANDTITITLHRPDRHNAVNRQLRDELSAALSLAVGDPAARVVVRGDGPSFCSGGDLDEFGTFDDPATAHLARMTASVGLLMARLAPRTEVHLHGMCLGAGIELPAFADKVAARGDSRFGLPEIELGLIPGAGGTVSLPRRIGRLRTAELALTARTIDAATALRWGLIDEIER